MDTDPRISGKFHESKGGMKESIGNIIGAPHLARSGQQERVGGQSEINAARSQGLGEGTGDIVDSPSSTVRGSSGSGAGSWSGERGSSGTRLGAGERGSSAARGTGSGTGLLDTLGLSGKGNDTSTSARERTSGSGTAENLSPGLSGDQENLRGVGHGSGDLGSTLRDVDRKRNV